MKSECLVEGQISIFDLPVIEVVKPKEIIILVVILNKFLIAYN